MSNLMQRLCVLGAAIAAVGASFLQATGALGLTPAAFAASGAGTVRAASYAFAIWGVIYAGLLVYAVYQLFPGRPDAAVRARFGWPSVVSMLAIGAWLVAAGADWRWATVCLIALAAAVLIIPLLATPDAPVQRSDGLLVVVPLALLAGWLTIATALNVLTELTAERVIAAPDAKLWAIAGVAATTVVGWYVAARSRVVVYLLPIIWGLVAVFVAERANAPATALTALAAALLLSGVLIRQIVNARSA